MAADRTTVVRSLLRIGEYFEALDATRALAPGAAASLLRARALQGLGALAAARAELAAMPRRARGPQESERRGLLASLTKTEALRASGAARQDGLGRALRAYARAAEAEPGSPWHAINVASLAAVLGKARKARATAEQVLARCARRERAGLSDGDAYWVPATRAEALLVLGRLDEALAVYAAVARHARRRRWWFHLKSSLGNARLLLHGQPDARSLVEAALAIPPVLVFSGHLVDAPGRSTPRFPSSAVPAVRTALRAALRERTVAVGVSGAAAGGDLLFQEALAALRIPAAVVLPQEGAWYLDRSVRGRPGAPWEAMYRRAVRRAQPCLGLVRHGFPDEGLLFEYANEVQEGYARTRAANLGTHVEHLVLWDGREGDGRGGTASLVRRWASGSPDTVRVIDPRQPSAGARPLATPPRRPRRRAGTRPARARSLTAALCFADVHHYSLLDEEQVLAFVEHVLPRVAETLARHGEAVLARNTWGDAVFAAFSDIAAAATFALDLVDLFAERPWPDDALPGDLGIRVALHAGPVHRIHDALLGTPSVTGAGVSHAARYEPVTPLGCLYASAPFVALLRARDVAGLRATYVGQLDLPKGHGRFPAYHITRDVPA